MGNPLRCIRRTLWAAVLGLATVMAVPAAAKAPNIVFILTDDQDAVTASQMPLLKSLIADRGATFRHHYVSIAVCCPSRAATLRGQFAHNSGIYSNNLPDGGFELVHSLGLEASTLATWLQSAGYRTALYGKYLNGYPETAPTDTYVPPGWTEWMSPIDGEPHSGFNYTMNHNGVPVPYGAREADYLTDVISNQAASFIRNSVGNFPDAPFLVYLAPYTPHGPAIPAPRHEDAFKDLKAPRPPSFNEADVSDKPAWVRALPLLTNKEIKKIDSLYVKRRQSLLSIDDLIQNIVSTLESVGELDNTYIFFSSDNGYHLGEHRFEPGKDTGFEEDIKVPLMVRGPGVLAGRTIDLFSANVDYAPTFADIAGVAAPAFVDGRSLLPLLRGQRPPDWRRAVLLEHKRPAPPARAQAIGIREFLDPFDWISPLADATGFVGLRTADGYTYIEYTTGERELYNNVSDPYQLRNSYNWASQDLKARLAAWVGSLKDASGAALREAEVGPPGAEAAGRLMPER